MFYSLIKKNIPSVLSYFHHSFSFIKVQRDAYDLMTKLCKGLEPNQAPDVPTTHIVLQKKGPPVVFKDNFRKMA
jgi:hypothetical protein